MEDQIALVAKEANVDLFNRFAVMRNWREVQHIPFDAFVAPDRAAHERLGLCLRGEASRRRDHRSGDPSDRIGRGAFRALNAS